MRCIKDEGLINRMSRLGGACISTVVLGDGTVCGWFLSALTMDSDSGAGIEELSS